MKLGVNWDYFMQGLGFKAYQRSLATIRRLGFDGVMITGTQERDLRGQIKKIKSAIKAEGLAVLQVHPSSGPNMGAYEPTERDNAVEVFKRWIGYALELGSDTLIVHPMGWRHLFDEEERKVVRDRNLECIRQLDKEVKNTKLKLALENLPLVPLLHEHPGHGYGFHIEELTELVDMLASRRVGVCLDVDHAFGAGLNVQQAIRACKGYLITTHLVDGKDIYELHHLLPGDGNIDWQEVADTLKEIGYRGPWVMEVSPWDDKKNRMITDWKQATRMLETSRDYLRETYNRANSGKATRTSR